MKILPKNIHPDDYLGKGTEFIYLFFGFAFIVIFAVFSLNWFTELDLILMSSVGAILGGILGPLFALLVGVFTFLAFYVQYDANKKIQAQFLEQEVNQLFSEMLRLHKENVNEFSIDGYTYLNKKKNGKKKSVKEVIFRKTEKRKVFVTMISELEAIQTICEYYSTNNGLTDIEIINHFAYEIFFFGVKSPQLKGSKVGAPISKMIKDELKKIRNIHEETGSEQNRFRLDMTNSVSVYTKYKPFSGHENRLSHYYRHLFSTVTYIVNKEKEKRISPSKSREYLKLLRAQMSNDEQLLLYYNYRIGYGKNWDKLGTTGNTFFTEYKMIHNIPLKKVTFTEKAEDHFADYIRLQDPNLFEQL